jgi:prepilin-type N-terminal cleavage/methylation domain-containing protein
MRKPAAPPGWASPCDGCTSAASGFSLIEVLGAMALLSVIVLATSALSVGVMHRVYGGKTMTAASSLAQSILERVNHPQAYRSLDALSTASSAEKVFERKVNSGSLTITEAETSSNGANWAERNTWRQLFLDAHLPYGEGDAQASQLVVRVEPVPSTATFGTATMLKIQVGVRWSERGVRPREVFLETLNLRSPE